MADARVPKRETKDAFAARRGHARRGMNISMIRRMALMSVTLFGKPLDIKLLQISLRLGGIITLAIGLAHLFFPSAGYNRSIPDSMSPVVRDHFFFLATYAIAAFLLSIGTISVLFSRLSHLPSAITIASVLAVLWSVRLALELAFPVEVALFIVPRPSSLILPTIGLMAALYVAAVLMNAPKLFIALK
jgi:hypothetical protein